MDSSDRSLIKLILVYGLFRFLVKLWPLTLGAIGTGIAWFMMIYVNPSYETTIISPYYSKGVGRGFVERYRYTPHYFWWPGKGISQSGKELKLSEYVSRGCVRISVTDEGGKASDLGASVIPETVNSGKYAPDCRAGTPPGYTSRFIGSLVTIEHTGCTFIVDDAGRIRGIPGGGTLACKGPQRFPVEFPVRSQAEYDTAQAQYNKERGRGPSDKESWLRNGD
jgi:hypothetical protein